MIKFYSKYYVKRVERLIMYEFILYTFTICVFGFIFWCIFSFLRIPNIVKQKYGLPNYTFVTSIVYSPLKNSSCFGVGASALNPTFIFIYTNFMIIKNNGSEWIINQNNFIEFSKPTFLKNCSIKIKEDNIYKSECIEFTFLSQRKIKLLEKFLISL